MKINTYKNINDVVVIIPAYNPDEKFISFLQKLKDTGYSNVLVVDDGSREDTKYFFDIAKNEYNCHLVTHSINLGQGRAYKSAFNYFLRETRSGGV